MNWYYCYKYNPNYYQQKQKHEHKPENLIYIQIIPPHSKCLKYYINQRIVLNFLFFLIQVLNSINCEYKQVINFYKDELENLKNEHTVNKNDFELMGDESNQFAVFNGSSQTESREERESYLLKIFHKEWELRKPLLIRGLHHNISATLWTPESFSNEFGSMKVSLVNCKNGRIINELTMEKFWNGFENIEEREKDAKNRPMILKLKDWPTADDFKQLLPSRFDDLMNNLPIGEYTHRDGQFNLVSRLPDFFCKPDLGPKLYIAYSSAETPKEGTTNLHVDISDAVNLVMYVGDGAKNKSNEHVNDGASSVREENENKAGNVDPHLLKVIKNSDCGEAQLKRFLNGEKPGALWHLFKPEDADKIRTFLLLVSWILI